MWTSAGGDHGRTEPKKDALHKRKVTATTRIAFYPHLHAHVHLQAGRPPPHESYMPLARVEDNNSIAASTIASTINWREGRFTKSVGRPPSLACVVMEKLIANNSQAPLHQASSVPY
jgi:hypothetical protein